MPETEHAARVADRRGRLAEFAAEIAGARIPLVLEIGCGHGHFLTAYGAAHADRLCIGLDINRDRVERAERKRRRAGLDRVRFIQADAEDFLAALPAEIRFRTIFLLFPDPWPKRRHHKNRLMRAPLLRQLAAHGEPDARLHFRTDHAEFFSAARAAVARDSGWECVEEPWPFEFATVFQSRAAAHQSLVARLC